MDQRVELDFDLSIRDGVRAAGSRGAAHGPRPARVIEVRFDPNPEAERRVLWALGQVVGTSPRGSLVTPVAQGETPA